jgi:hypothetical protein
VVLPAPFVPLQNGGDACETQRWYRGPEASLFTAVLTERGGGESLLCA